MFRFLLCLGQHSIDLGNCYVLQLGNVMYLPPIFSSTIATSCVHTTMFKQSPKKYYDKQIKRNRLSIGLLSGGGRGNF